MGSGWVFGGSSEKAVGTEGATAVNCSWFSWGSWVGQELGIGIGAGWAGDTTEEIINWFGCEIGEIYWRVLARIIL